MPRPRIVAIMALIAAAAALGVVRKCGLRTSAAPAAVEGRRVVESRSAAEPLDAVFGLASIARHSRRSVDGVVAARQAEVAAALAEPLRRAGLPWPVPRLALVALKGERVLELWGRSGESAWRLVRTYPILAASGGPGPKLREGDLQVPEGVYRVEGLNPNSRFYLSIKVDYPSGEDKALAGSDGRKNLGGDIFIHGSAVSIGCLALGDAAIEEVFVTAAKAKRPIPVLIAPRDFRRAPPRPADSAAGPAWLRARYGALAKAMEPFRQ